MKPLDLTKQPPRAPRTTLAGIVFMARTVDKMRALLPGGEIGAYKIAGTSELMLREIGLSETELQAMVASAEHEDDLERWLLEHVDDSRIAAANEAVENRPIASFDPGVFERYPVAAKLPPTASILDVLELDDAAMFGAQS